MYGTCAGESSLAEAGLNEGQAISLFPQTYPHAATAITRGVKVCAEARGTGQRGEGARRWRGALEGVWWPAAWVHSLLWPACSRSHHTGDKVGTAVTETEQKGGWRRVLAGYQPVSRKHTHMQTQPSHAL
jgi:hypothetical protein